MAINVLGAGLPGSATEQSLRQGTARGIGPQGGLLFEPAVTHSGAGDTRIEQLLAAEVSVREQDGRN